VSEIGGIKQILDFLGYRVALESQNFQFEKTIPNSQEIMRIEFMAPHELKRRKDFRAEISRRLHARECFGGSIALHECDSYKLTGGFLMATRRRQRSGSRGPQHWFS